MRSSAIVMLAMAAGCMRNPVPDERILEAEQLPRWTRGLWAVAEPVGSDPIDGELVAADKDGVVLLTERGVARLALADCERVTVAAYRTYDSVPGIWSLFGLASTVSHGGFLLISAPVWALTGSITLVNMHNHPIYRYPDERIESLARFARFPQGLPPGWTPP
jgi:hypothetical protein